MSGPAYRSTACLIHSPCLVSLVSIPSAVRLSLFSHDNAPGGYFLGIIRLYLPAMGFETTQIGAGTACPAHFSSAGNALGINCSRQLRMNPNSRECRMERIGCLLES